MANTSDFSYLSSLYPSGPSGLARDPASPEAQVADVEKQQFAKLGDVAARGVAEEKQNQPMFQLPAGVQKMTVDKNGVGLHGMDPRVLEGYIQSKQKVDEIMGSFHQESERIKSQEARLSTPAGAIGQAVSTLAGNLATQRDMPGWVRGLGQTAKDLNPSRDVLEARRLGLLKEEAGMAEQSQRLGMERQRVGMEGQRMDLEATREKRLGEEEARRKTEDVTKDLRDTRDKLMSAAQKGEAPPADAVRQIAREGGYTPEKAEAMTKMVMGTNAAALKKISDDRQKAFDLEKQKEDAALKREIQREGAAIKAAEAAASRSGAKEEQKKKVADDKKEFTAYEKVAKPLQNLITLDKQTNELEKLLDDADKEGLAIGPVEGRIPNLFVSRKTARVRSEMITMVAGINDAVIKGGTRLWNPTEWKALSTKLVESTKTGAFNRGILDSIRAFTNNTRGAIVSTQQDVDWKKRKSSLGSQADELLGGDLSTEAQVKKLLDTVKPR